MLRYQLAFFGSTEPYIVTKKQARCLDALCRDNMEAMAGMAGFIQMYYTDLVPSPISKKNMLVSVFLTRLHALILHNRDYSSDEDELWLFLGDGRFERAKPEFKTVNGRPECVSVQRSSTGT